MEKNRKISHLLNVFISSKDMLESERDVAEEVIRSLNMNPLRAETDKWFATPNSKEYLRLIDTTNIVILIVDLEAKFSNAEEYYRYVKEEIDRAFSLGIAVLAFFKDENGTQKDNIDNFVEGIQYKLFSRVFKDQSELSSVIRESILNELFRKYTSPPLLIHSSKKIYTETSLLVEKCKFRFCLSQQTPIVLLGPRTGRDFEKKLFDQIRNLIDKNKNDKSKEIVFLYDSVKTDEELEKNGGNYNPKLMNNNIKYFKKIFKSHSEINLSIISCPSDIVQFVISDTYYLFGNHTPDIALAILDDNPEIVNEMMKIVEQKTSYNKSSGLEAFVKLLEKYN